MDPGGADKQGGLPAEDAVIRKGYLKKLKNMKKKYFVLRGDTPEKSARLEYYDTEKKWKSNATPKKSILLKNCFNITRRLDVRQKHVIALYTRKEVHCVVAEGEEELAEWLAALLELLHPEDALLNTPQPNQLVWQVNIQKKGLGASRNIVGNYTLRLTEKSLILTKMRSTKTTTLQAGPMDYVEYSLSSIRRCGDSESFFYMEVGRSSVTGAGELWMHTEDSNIAKSMHTTVLIAMSNSLNTRDELDPKSRTRSSSATEASKPISVLSRRQTHQGTKPHGLSPSSESTFCSGRSCVGLCISPCENQSAAYCAPQTIQETQEAAPTATQPPGTQNGTKPQREDSVMLNVSHERTRSLPITGEETTSVIPTYNLMKTRSVDKAGSFNECVVDNKRLSHCNGSYVISKRKQMAFAGLRRASTGCRLGHAPHVPCLGSVHGIMVSGGNVRERCDSLPSRGNTPGVGGGANAPRVPPHPPGVTHRPHSMYIRGISHSPPANSPLSPHSAGAYSTDSAGSSVSIDETDNFSHHGMFIDDPSHMNHTRLINSRTPDERSIPEEGIDDSLVLWQPEKCLSESVEKGNIHKQPYSGLDKSFSAFAGGIVKELQSMRKSSIGGMPEVSSPVLVPNSGTSPQDQSGYMPMSPASAEPVRLVHSRVGGNSSNHSRTSSLAEDVPDGIVKPEEGYVDMEPNKEGVPHALSPAASTASVTSGTPSTDIRFSEFHLDKVSSYFAPEEDGGSRPLRAYSVGSRPEHVKKIINRHDIHSSVLDSSRTRAFSCGSKSRHNRDNRILNHSTPPHSHIQHIMNAANPGTKSSSTPILGTGGSLYRHTYNSSHSSVEPLDDLMEMDFSNRTDSSSSVKTEVPPPPVSIPKPAPAPPPSNSNADGYMDMAPVGMTTAGYVEMKPADSCPSDPIVTQKLLEEAVRKISITKPHYDSMEKIQQNNESLPPKAATTADGYVEMSWNNAKPASSKPSRSRIPSLPITINSANPKDLKNQPASSASPVFSMASILKGENEKAENAHGTPPKMSPGTSPATQYTPSPMSSLKKSKKQQSRRNSAELTTPTSAQPQTIFPFSPGSPVKYCSTKSPLYNPERKLECSCSVDSPTPNPFSIERTIADSFDVSAYMEMAPARLSTVKELNESCGMKSPVDKNLKQIMNNATKVSSDNKSSVSNKASSQTFIQQKSVEEVPSRSKSSSSTSKIQCMPIKVPTFSPTVMIGSRNIDSNCKENQDILSSNPTATRTLVSNPLNKPNNTYQVPLVKKPILVISQTQPITPDFRPIPAYEIEQKSTKSGSPKQCESALNRQLSYYDNKTRSNKEDPCDGYEMLAAQNGQMQKVTSSRPGSVNNNKGKKEGGSGSRPPSVNSEGGTKEKSRPSSVSSEIGGTPCSSRPGSVVGEREKLHYVSLDLNPATVMSPRQPPVGGVYSTIDFVKCEELKNSKNLAAKSTN